MKSNTLRTDKNAELQEKIETQKSHAKEFRPTTRLEDERGNEISRSGREIPARDVVPAPEAAVQEGEELGEQNAIGGQRQN